MKRALDWFAGLHYLLHAATALAFFFLVACFMADWNVRWVFLSLSVFGLGAIGHAALCILIVGAACGVAWLFRKH